MRVRVFWYFHFQVHTEASLIKMGKWDTPGGGIGMYDISVICTVLSSMIYKGYHRLSQVFQLIC